MCELDALAALALGLSSDVLTGAYRSMFPVLRRYEAYMFFDADGNRIAQDRNHYGFVQGQVEERAKAENRIGWRRVWDRVDSYQDGEVTMDVAPFKPPFERANRETAMTRAMSEFTLRFGAHQLATATPDV